MEDQFDVNLEDTEHLSEVELTADLVIAASQFERHLTDREIDRILRVVPRQARELERCRPPLT